MAGIGVGVDNSSNWRGIRINIQHKINIRKGCSLKGIHAWLGHGAIVQIICIGESYVITNYAYYTRYIFNAGSERSVRLWSYIVVIRNNKLFNRRSLPPRVSS